MQLIGDLAAILELAVSGQQKTAIQTDSGVGRVFSVAGARNRRYLHLHFATLSQDESVRDRLGHQFPQTKYFQFSRSASSAAPILA